MKKIRTIIIVVLGLVLISSECGSPDMLVINEIQEDGSINRKLIITNGEDDFDLDDLQVPVDSTWTLDKTLEVSERGDSLWTLTAEKHILSVDDLNFTYNNQESSNQFTNRWAEFSSKFRWFNTIYYYSENIEKAIDGLPPEDFFEDEYLGLFYMPEKIFNDLRYGEDSLKYKAMDDTLEQMSEEWLVRSLVRAAIIELDSLLLESDNKSIDIASIWEKEDELGAIFLEMGEEAIDTLFGVGYYEQNQALIDSSMNRLDKKLEVYMAMVDYLIQTKMPGELVGTNGYIDTEGGIIWEVDGDVILSKNYSMWAQSVVTNTWAWIVTIGFLLFVIIGFIIKARRGR